jgi:hypothetical protein
MQTGKDTSHLPKTDFRLPLLSLDIDDRQFLNGVAGPDPTRQDLLQKSIANLLPREAIELLEDV